GGAAAPVDVERGEHLRMLVEAQEDQRPQTEHERRERTTLRLQALEVCARVVGGQVAEPPRAPHDERRRPVEQAEPYGECDAHRRREVRKELLDRAQYVVVDRLIEAVAPRANGRDGGAEDAQRPGGNAAGGVRGGRRGHGAPEASRNAPDIATASSVVRA